MAYKVLSDFKEDGHIYRAGDTYPYGEVEIDQKRADFLANASINKNVSYIEKIAGSDNEDIKADQFKGVKETKLRNKLAEAEIEVPEGIDREGLIQLMIDNNLSA